MKNAISILRVSTKKQLQGESIAVQREQNARYCKEKKFTIAKEFEFAESASGIKRRKQFELVMDYCKVNKDSIDSVVVWKLDRLSRQGLLAFYNLKEFLKDCNIELHSATENIDETPMGQFSQGILALTANLENTTRTSRTIPAQKKLTSLGFWTRPAPLGFRNVKKVMLLNGESKRKPVLEFEQNNREYELVQYGLQKQLTGLYSQSEIARELTEKGLTTKRNKPLCVQTWNKMCRAPVYGGMMQEKWTDNELIDAQFKGIITKQEWHQLQNILNGKRNNTPTTRVTESNDFPLRRFLLCSTCNEKSRGYFSSGKHKKYSYYDCRCTQCNFRVSTEPTHTLYKEVLATLTPTDRSLKVFEALVLESFAKLKEGAKNAKNTLVEKELEIKKQQQGIITTIKQCADTPEIVEDLKEQYITLKNQLKSLQNKPTEQLLQIDAKYVLTQSMPLIANPVEHWDKSLAQSKIRLQYAVFPTGINYSNLEHCRTPEKSLIYAILEGIENGNIDMVVPRGIEPLFPG